MGEWAEVIVMFLFGLVMVGMFAAVIVMGIIMEIRKPQEGSIPPGKGPDQQQIPEDSLLEIPGILDLHPFKFRPPSAQLVSSRHQGLADPP